MCFDRRTSTHCDVKMRRIQALFGATCQHNRKPIHRLSIWTRAFVRRWQGSVIARPSTIPIWLKPFRKRQKVRQHAADSCGWGSARVVRQARSHTGKPRRRTMRTAPMATRHPPRPHDRRRREHSRHRLAKPPISAVPRSNLHNQTLPHQQQQMRLASAFVWAIWHGRTPPGQGWRSRRRHRHTI